MATALVFRRAAAAVCSAACALPLLAAGFGEDDVFVDSNAPRYNDSEAVELAALATAAYCDKVPVEAWDCGKACVDGMSGARVAFDPHTTAFAVVGRFHDECAVSFRGSASSEQWAANLMNAVQAPFYPTWPGVCSFEGEQCRVGTGFQEQYWSIAAQVRKHLADIYCHAPARLTLTGHSLGGAIAAIAAIDLGGSGWVPAKFYSFGQPRPGNAVFAKAVWEKFRDKPFFRVTRKDDPVPFLPARDQTGNEWVHTGREIYYKGSTDLGYRVCNLRIDGDELCAYDMKQARVSVLAGLCKVNAEKCSHFQYLQPKLKFMMVDFDGCDSSTRFTLV